MRRRTGAQRLRFPSQYVLARLSVSTQVPAGKSKSLPQQKSPTRQPGASGHRFLSRKALTSAAREGSLACGFSAADSGGTAADSHGLPHFPCLQNWKLSVCRGSESVNARHEHIARNRSAILPVWFALFNQCAEPFLRILEAIEFVEENIHGIFHTIAQRKAHAAENGFLGHG
jgi:hypothetical protein